MNDKKNLEIKQVINQSYKYGFITEIETEKFDSGINEDIVKLISKKKEEPLFLQEFRLKAYKKWKKMVAPNWANLEIK
jgi:Fe-S cluster assembly protein SufB